MAGPRLFEPKAVGALTLSNRIVIAPMCQYSAVDGCMTDWHQIHLGNLALSGAALLTIEATAVLPEGRISYADVGLYDDATEAAMARTIESVRRWSDMPIAIQLAHAGRKASTDLPWKGGAQIAPDHVHGWQTVAPSPIGADVTGSGLSPASWESLTPMAAILKPFASLSSQKSIAVAVNGFGPWVPVPEWAPEGPVATSMASTFA